MRSGASICSGSWAVIIFFAPSGKYTIAVFTAKLDDLAVNLKASDNLGRPRPSFHYRKIPANV